MTNRILIFSILSLSISLFGQFDSAKMEKLSRLSPQQKKQLQQRYADQGGSPAAAPTASLPNREVQVEQPDEESFNDRTEFLGDLNQMEKMISADVVSLQSQLELDDSSEDNELLEALNESKALLSKIKELQRREIEKRAEEFGMSEANTIKPFGYDLFASDPSTFAPGNEVPIPSDYRIGPGDLLEIQLFGQQNESYSLGISSDGLIRFPGIGPINAFENGTTFLELKNHLKLKIREQLGEGVQSSISLGAFRSIRVFLLGEVRRQGGYTVSALSTMLNALLTGGGIKETGSLRKVELKREGKIFKTIDLYDLMLKGDIDGDSLLQPNDVIFVPMVENQITVSGSVRRPAKYEILGGETLQNVISLAGGSTNRAYLENIRLERLGSDYRPRVKNLKLPEDLSFPVQTGDLISIESVGVRVTNSVSLIGNVERPGEYEWKKGVRIRDFIEEKEDLLPKTDLNYGIIRRKNEDGTVTVLSFSPSNALRNATSPDNLILQEQDALYFFPLDKPRDSMIEVIISDLNQQKKPGSSPKVVKISGLVRYPGDYPLTDKMDLEDLLRASGGLIDASYTLSAELTRVSDSNGTNLVVSHIQITEIGKNKKESIQQFFLEPNDHLVVRKIPHWSESRTILLEGEFKFPGEYRLSRGETIAGIVERAGGISEDGFLDGAIFTREHIRLKETKQRNEFINRLENLLAYENLEKGTESDSTSEQSLALLARLKSFDSIGRLVVDLNEQLTPSSNNKIIVMDGDRLLVPKKPQEITVGGEVNFPTSHLYKKSQSVLDWIEYSGGFTSRSDKDRIAIIKTNGMVISGSSNKWFSSRNAKMSVDSGDMIIVPVKIELPNKFLENLAFSTQIIYQIALAAAAVNSF
jgi:protein involved in polysaccharide export with SLBB domain